MVHRGNSNPNWFYNQTRAQLQRVAAEKEKQGRRSMWRCLRRHMTLRPCFDIVHRGNQNPTQYKPNRRSQRGSPIRKGRRTQRMCSFRGSYINRGNGTELSSSDVVPVAGIEPARPCGLGILSPVRLPVPPHRPVGGYIKEITFVRCTVKKKHIFPSEAYMINPWEAMAWRGKSGGSATKT